MKSRDNPCNKQQSLSLHLTAFWPGIPYLSLGVWMAWQLLVFSGGSWISDENDSFNIAYMILWLCVITALVLLAAPFFKTFVSRMLASKSFHIAMGLLGSLGGLLHILAGPYYTGFLWVANTAFVFNGISSAFLALKCGQIYGGLPPHKILVYALLSVLLSVAIFFFVLGSDFYILIPGGPPLVGILALLMLSPIAVWLLSMGADATEPDNTVEANEAVEATRAVEANEAVESNSTVQTTGIDDSNDTASLPAATSLPAAFWKLIIAVFLFTLATASVRSLYLTPQTPEATQINSNIVVFLIAVFALIMLLVALRFLRNVSFARIYLVTAMLIAAVLVFTPLLPVDRGILSSIAGFAASVLDFTIWCLLAFIVSEKHFSAITVFGFGRGIAFAGSGIGWALGMFVIPEWTGTTFETIFDILLALLVIASAVFLFTEKDYDSLFSSISNQQLDINEYASLNGAEKNKKETQSRPWMEACQRVGSKVRLTEREQQIMEQISLGRSQKLIAQRLTISHNTVRTHTGNVYAKLDVHSREELIELIEAEYTGHSHKQ